MTIKESINTAVEAPKAAPVKVTKPISRKTVKSKQTSVGTAEYINKETGEVETFSVISEKDVDFNFQKIWLGHLLESLDVIGNKKIKVLNYLLRIKNTDNIVIGTQRAIAKGAGVSLPVVNETIKALVRIDALKQQQQGVLMLNPDIMFKGGNGKRMNILLRYDKINQIEHDESEGG